MGPSHPLGRHTMATGRTTGPAPQGQGLSFWRSHSQATTITTTHRPMPPSHIMVTTQLTRRARTMATTTECTHRWKAARALTSHMCRMRPLPVIPTEFLNVRWLIDMYVFR
ncbi:hypothetical protein BT93_L5248 [Corymbia citriodora subsp. variegata]|uniref:Uncharacterized protein n=1 Tax=Corymbia citriodora subsp. variegata TaxID=360336 RepID=A0A8T0CSK3_CORYI|nr:hypothetical protein BT93_L5248 [Corymbia citriodora subsp. variegata]